MFTGSQVGVLRKMPEDPSSVGQVLGYEYEGLDRVGEDSGRLRSTAVASGNEEAAGHQADQDEAGGFGDSRLQGSKTAGGSTSSTTNASSASIQIDSGTCTAYGVRRQHDTTTT